MTQHEQRVQGLILHACEHRAVLPWVKVCIRLAQAAEDDRQYRSLLRCYGELQAQLDALDADLLALDPEAAKVFLDKCYARNPAGTPNWAKRCR
jgi:hypothetical protein